MTVSLPNDHARYPAKKIIEENGIALLKINAPHMLPFANLTQPKDLHSGDTVISFNAQINTNNFISRGTVSQTSTDGTTFITDAPITNFDGGGVFSINWNNPTAPYLSLAGLVTESAGYFSAFTMVAQAQTISKLLATARGIAETDTVASRRSPLCNAHKQAHALASKNPAACDNHNDLPTLIAQASATSLLVHLKLPAAADGGDPGPELLYPAVLINGQGSVLATNVFNSDDQLFITTRDGEKLPTVVVGVDNDKRLSFLKIKPIARPFAPLSTETLHAGEPFIAIGWEKSHDHPTSQVAVAARVSNPSRTFDSTVLENSSILPTTTALIQGDFPTMNGAILYTMNKCKVEVAGVAPSNFITGPLPKLVVSNHGISFAVPANAISSTFTPPETPMPDENSEPANLSPSNSGAATQNQLARTPHP